MKEKLFFLLLSVVLVRSEFSHVDIWQIQNLTVPDLRFVCFDYNVTGISEKCDEQLNVLCQNLTVLLTMLDAWSKPYPGLRYASRMDLGNFDECMSVNYKYEGGRILGEYCATGLVIPDILGNMSDPDSFYTLAVCRPDGCSASDLNTILGNLLENFSLPLFQDLLCQTVETGTGITASDIVTITIIAICILLMVVSSIYDFYLYKRKLSSPSPVFLAFSVLSNGRKLLHVTKNSKEQIYTFQGIRVISMMWIIAGHGFALWGFLPVSNVSDTVEWESKTYAGYITTARLAVDTFFFISGFLLAYQFLKQKPKPLKAHLISVPQLYIHRYIRLTPAILMAFLVSISVFKYMGSGPLWFEATTTMGDTCRKYWWSFFLYIQNYYNHEDLDLCIVPTWYLSADMQMFLLSPLVMIPVALHLRKPTGFKSSMMSLLVLNVFCTFIPMIIKLVCRDYDNQYDTHSRLINYFIGAMLGVFMRVRQDKPFLYMINSQRKSLINFLTWVLILLGMLAIVICHHSVETYNGYVSQSVFDSLMRPAWCTGLSWIIYSCYHGYGGIVNWILCRPIFQVLGRLTYCMYILHELVQARFAGTTRERFYFSDYNVFYLFCGHYVVTAIIALFWTLAFESPLITLEKVVFGGTTKKKEVKPPTNGNIEEGSKKEVK